jgi:hypothetical protein
MIDYCWRLVRLSKEYRISTARCPVENKEFRMMKLRLRRQLHSVARFLHSAMLSIAPVEMTRVSVFSRESKNGDFGRNDNKMDSCFRRNDSKEYRMSVVGTPGQRPG